MYYFLISLFFFIGVVVLLFIVLYRKLAKKTTDLEERNRRLSALRKLDEVMISSSRDFMDVAQEVTNDIADELGFEIGVLALVDESKGVLKRVAMSNTQTGLQAKRTLPFPYEKLEIPLNCEQNLAIQAFKTNQRKITHDLYDVFVPVLDKNISKEIQETVGVKTSLVYPVRARERAIGVMIISVSRLENQLSAYELESIENLVDVIGIALENSILYQDLRITTQKLQEANSRLKTIDQLKDDFVSIASHELRTPMTAIRSYAWMALHRSDVPLSKTMEKYIARILISTERLINLVNDMLNVSRIESGRIEINPEPVDLLSLVKDIIDELYYSKSPEKTVQFTVLEKPIPKVLADPDKLRQIFLNLVGNSLKFTPAGGKITFDFFTDGKVVETSVSDNGVGMTKEDLSKLFSKFGRLDNSYTAAATSGGTGLGLYISKKLVELMHGKIWASSAGSNKGSTFTVSMPVVTVDSLKKIDLYRVKPKGEAKGLEPVAI